MDTKLHPFKYDQSRLSPFANTRGKKGKKETSEVTDLRVTPKSTASKSKKFKRWFSLVEAATLSRKRALLPVKKLRSALVFNSKLHRTLYGFIVFEIAWHNVRGLNYLNELQVPGCVSSFCFLIFMQVLSCLCFCLLPCRPIHHLLSSPDS